jgi:hypothetical protein
MHVGRATVSCASSSSNGVCDGSKGMLMVGGVEATDDPKGGREEWHAIDKLQVATEEAKETVGDLHKDARTTVLQEL